MITAAISWVAVRQINDTFVDIAGHLQSGEVSEENVESFAGMASSWGASAEGFVQSTSQWIRNFSYKCFSASYFTTSHCFDAKNQC